MLRVHRRRLRCVHAERLSVEGLDPADDTPHARLDVVLVSHAVDVPSSQRDSGDVIVHCIPGGDVRQVPR